MEKLCRRLARKRVKVETVIGFGSPVEQINECVRSGRVDLIGTSTHGRTALKRVVIGSTGEQIVFHGICPLLVAPNRMSQKKTRSVVNQETFAAYSPGVL